MLLVVLVSINRGAGLDARAVYALWLRLLCHCVLKNLSMVAWSVSSGIRASAKLTILWTDDPGSVHVPELSLIRLERLEAALNDPELDRLFNFRQNSFII